MRRWCQTLQVSVSGYYAWRQRSPSQRTHTDEQLTECITHVYQANRCVYGSPRMHAELREQGWHGGRKHIARLMRQAGISARRTRRCVRTTDSQHTNPVAPHRLQRDFQAGRHNEKWVGDITGVWTRQGWLYLAAVLDRSSRGVIGWAMAATREEELVRSALRMALHARRPQAGLVHHSDCGSQYTSRDYQGVLRAWGIEVSMSRKGDGYDNALMERFFASLKGECTDRQHRETQAQARQAIFEYLEVFYIRQRRHSALGYVSPVNYERQVCGLPSLDPLQNRGKFTNVLGTTAIQLLSQ